MKALPSDTADRRAGADKAMDRDDARASHDAVRPAVELYDPFSTLCTPQFSDHDFDHF